MMESPVLLDKPPEHYLNERGFPFDEEEGSDTWSDLLVRHPELAARLRPSTWARKKRPSSQDGIDDSGDNFGGFDRFPFNNIPPEFRDHFPSQWADFSPREERHQPTSPQHQTAATQTETDAGSSQENTQVPLPQYGLRNTVDLGQKSPADPSLVNAEDRSQRSMSAPPDHNTVNPNKSKMSGQGHQEQTTHQPQEQQSNVRHIPIFVEGRDEPVINKNVDHGTHFADAKPTYVPPPQPHVDREPYYTDDGPTGFSFAKSFDRPFFRQGAQPFTKQKMYPQAAFTRGTSPQRSQSPKPSFHDQHIPRAETPSRPQQKQPPAQQKQPQYNNQSHQPEQTAPQQAPHAQSPPKQPPSQQQAPSANDPISKILGIQTDVLNLMTDVENFTGTKKDKQYIYLDEMLTRNLIKLDDIETDGKENIRQARKEAIKCIQKCIAVLEAKAENKGVSTPQPLQDVEMQATENENATLNPAAAQNGDVEMKESSAKTENKEEVDDQCVSNEPHESSEIKTNSTPAVAADEKEPKVEDTRPNEIQPEIQESVEKKSPKKTMKKRDKSKDKKKLSKDKDNKNDDANEEQEKIDDVKDVDKKGDLNENMVNKKQNNEVCVNNETEGMQIDGKGEKKDLHSMEVDGAASQ